MKRNDELDSMNAAPPAAPAAGGIVSAEAFDDSYGRGYGNGSGYGCGDGGVCDDGAGYGSGSGPGYGSGFGSGPGDGDGCDNGCSRAYACGGRKEPLTVKRKDIAFMNDTDCTRYLLCARSFFRSRWTLGSCGKGSKPSAAPAPSDHRGNCDMVRRFLRYARAAKALDGCLDKCRCGAAAAFATAEGAGALAGEGAGARVRVRCTECGHGTEWRPCADDARADWAALCS